MKEVVVERRRAGGKQRRKVNIIQPGGETVHNATGRSGPGW